MKAIVTNRVKTGRVTAWIPPEISNTLTVEGMRQLLHTTFRDLFNGGTFDATSGFTLNFRVARVDDRRRIIAGLRQHKIAVS